MRLCDCTQCLVTYLFGIFLFCFCFVFVARRWAKSHNRDRAAKGQKALPFDVIVC